MEEEMKMCDRIIMPDGTEIEEIDEFLGTVGPNLRCLCSFSQDAILRFIVNHLPEKLEIDQRLVIERDPFGYIVKIERAGGPEPASEGPVAGEMGSTPKGASDRPVATGQSQQRDSQPAPGIERIMACSECLKKWREERERGMRPRPLPDMVFDGDGKVE